MVTPAQLRSIPWFSQLPEEQLAALAAIGTERSLPAGAVVHSEDNVADTVYVILEGRVGVRISLRPFIKSRQLCLDVLQTGELFGWSALVPPHKLTGSAVCLMDVRLIAWEREPLRAALEKDPVLGYRFMSLLSEVVATRLRDARMQLIQELAQTSQD
jgi:CRP-like cAMP-binding protein